MSSSLFKVIAWSCVGLTTYVYLVYPVVVALLARWFGRPLRLRPTGAPLPSVSVVISAFNEERTIGRRVREFVDRIGSDRLDGASCDWVKSHWRWQPPTNAGQPTAAKTQINVTWNLKDAK